MKIPAKYFTRKSILLGLGCLGWAYLGVFAVEQISAQLALRNGQNLLKEGKPALAIDRIYDHRRVLSQSADGCRVLLLAAHQARNLDLLRYSSEACITSRAGEALPETYLAQAEIKDSVRDSDEAIRILENALERVDSPATIYVDLVRRFEKSKQFERADAVILRGLRHVSGDSGFQVYGFQYFVQRRAFEMASRVADMINLDNLKSDPGLIASIARIQYQFGKTEYALEAVKTALQLAKTGSDAQLTKLVQAHLDFIENSEKVRKSKSSKGETHAKS